MIEIDEKGLRFNCLHQTTKLQILIFSEVFAITGDGANILS
jgi:hypothetical protein